MAARRTLERTFFVVAASAACVGACVLAEPPSDLPRLPATRPTIVRAQVSPSADRVLASFPQDNEFIVPVELSDPSVSFQWSAFIDFDPGAAAGGDGLVDSELSDFDSRNTVGRVRTLPIQIPPPLDVDRCHVIEIDVALRFFSNNTALNAHTPADPTGSDSIVWFYSPTGDLAGCPVLDAGVQRSSEGGAEAGPDGAVP